MKSTKPTPPNQGNINRSVKAGVAQVLADKAYQGAGGTVRTPFKRHSRRPPLSQRQEEVNRDHARIRSKGERAVAVLKTWKILAKLRCCPQRATAIIQAILVLQAAETNRYPG